MKDYDYSQPGSYFVTICSHGHKKLFGDIETVSSVRVGDVRADDLQAGSEPSRTTNDNPEPALEEFSKMVLNSFGKIVLYTWEDLVNHNSGIRLGEYVIMPNHFHGIIYIVDPDTDWDDIIPSEFIFHDKGIDAGRTGDVLASDVRAGSEPARTSWLSLDNPEPALTNHLQQTPLSEIIRQLKTFSARRINQIRKTPGIPVWKRDYYEHIIRNQESYEQIVEYIHNNPMMWNMDKLFIE